jgi:arylformamidase
MRPEAMQLYDVTLPVYAGMPVYDGDPEVRVEPRLQIAAGDQVNGALLSLGSHTGTHVDAPRHFRDGAAGLDALALDVLVGPARVCEVAPAPHVDATHLSAHDLSGVQRLLLKTPNSARWRAGRFFPDFAALTPAAAQLLVALGVRLVGVDGLSVDPFGAAGAPAHHILLDAGVIILEGLDLSAVPPGAYQLLCLPLKIRDGDGAPARVLLTSPR